MNEFFLDIGPGQDVLHTGWDGAKLIPEALAIWGFEVGFRIPIGLYRATGNERD